MLSKSAHGPPEILLRFGAEDFGGFTLAGDLRLAEVQAATPAAVVQSADGDTDRDRLAVDPDRVELMHYGFPRVAGSGSEVRHAHDDTSGGGRAKIRGRRVEAMLIL